MLPRGKECANKTVHEPDESDQAMLVGKDFIVCTDMTLYG